MSKSKKILGVFFMGISVSMFILAAVYMVTKNISYGWMAFGISYSVCICSTLANKKLRKKLGASKMWNFLVYCLKN